MTLPEGQLPSDPIADQPFTLARRSFVFLGLGALVVAGCATDKSQQVLRTPDAIWPDVPPPPPEPSIVGSGPGANLVKQGPTPVDTGAPSSDTLRKGPLPNALARSTWARGAPIYTEMVPMLPPRWVTVHHDGMPTQFFATSEVETKARLEQVRNGHRARGWGDIGYHFVIDRAGRVWEGRYLKYQGAHVRFCNENNIGVMCLGNFEDQQPSAAQLATLQKTLVTLRTYYKIPAARVRTHREWPSASTLCPGANLQARIVAMRRNNSAA